ncbi:MAG: pantoate--beta-alanine ligase [Flavisolibacter sp.]|jgi:pantoate--beta-alanine ligase
MIIFKQAKPLTDYLQREQKAAKKIGLVPTMGALHNGHLSLINSSKSNNDITVCSIFVNPTQFNNPEDFKHYPITIEKDIEQLMNANCDVLFLPAVEEIYPPGYQKKHYNLGAIENSLEGFYRPGHFQGVCQVVDRLLEIINPDNLYMGQKDFQQCMVIKKLLELTGKDKTIRLNISPTIREKDGLAMSSRNLRLNETEKMVATSIYKELAAIKNNFHLQPFHFLKQTAKDHLTEKGFTVDYVEIANTEYLNPAKNSSEPSVALIAASLGNVRLIDNLILN